MFRNWSRRADCGTDAEPVKWKMIWTDVIIIASSGQPAHSVAPMGLMGLGILVTRGSRPWLLTGRPFRPQIVVDLNRCAKNSQLSLLSKWDEH